MFNNELTNEYINNTSTEYRKKRGQFFSPIQLQEDLFEMLPLHQNKTVLEPSCGTGEFIKPIMEKLNPSELDLIDIDNILPNIINEDFLTYDTDKKYDYIIGNPPYFEIAEFKQYEKSYKEVMTGRINIYTLFIKKAIDMLNDDGYLAFIIPTTMNTGSFFKKLRRYIVKYCDIIGIKEYSSEEFTDVLQHVQILILQKTTNTRKFVIELENDNYIFTTSKDKFIEHSTNKRNILDYGYKVFTGNVVWNQHKDKFIENGTPLIYANNIVDNKIVLSSQKPPKGQYIDFQPLPYEKIICVNRVIGNYKQPIFKMAIVDFPCVCENHINYIYPDNPTISIEELFEKLKNVNLELISSITNSTQLSKTELENLVYLD